MAGGVGVLRFQAHRLLSFEVHAIMSARLVVVLSAALLSSGCEVASELGKPCGLVKAPTAEQREAGILRAPVYESEVAANQDFISFGATDCEDLICVRDAESPRTVDPDNPDPQALGYCSKPCVQGSGASACEVTDTGVPEALRGRMTCRSLLLDQASLERLRAEDPDAYRNTFGDNNSPFFCAGALSNLPEN